jgi:FkbM family methyltransferase
MLIEYAHVANLLASNHIYPRGALHIGAHECEERRFYNTTLNLGDDKIIWIDGNNEKVEIMKKRGIPHIFNAVLDEVEREIEFNITTNTEASSLLELNHEKGFYNSIHIVERRKCKTQTLSSFFHCIDKNPADFNFWNLDIQGSELHVLRGSQELLKYCDSIYTEVNKGEVYKGCGLIENLDELLKVHGFDRIETKWTDRQWGDALYVRTKSI